MGNGKQVQTNIINFDGDSEILPFFFDQIRSVSQINKHNNQKTIALLKKQIIWSCIEISYTEN